jgi:hypothetical protein
LHHAATYPASRASHFCRSATPGLRAGDRRCGAGDQATLYYYFQSKAGLYQALIDWANDERYRLMCEAATREKGCRNN